MHAYLNNVSISGESGKHTVLFVKLRCQLLMMTLKIKSMSFLRRYTMLWSSYSYMHIVILEGNEPGVEKIRVSYIAF